MPRIDVRGAIVPNDYSWYYDFWGEEYTAPKNVKAVLDGAGGELVDVYINSPGGEISSGSEIYAMLAGYGNVMIHITGQAHSAASVIAMAGMSEMAPTALMMVHRVSTYAEGNRNDFEHMTEVLTAADEAMSTAYCRKSGMSQKEALKLMDGETWLTAAKAVEYGLVDKVMSEAAETAPMAAAFGFSLPSAEKLEQTKKFLEASSLKNKMELELLKLKEI